MIRATKEHTVGAGASQRWAELRATNITKEGLLARLFSGCAPGALTIGGVICKSCEGCSPLRNFTDVGGLVVFVDVWVDLTEAAHEVLLRELPLATRVRILPARFELRATELDSEPRQSGFELRTIHGTGVVDGANRKKQKKIALKAGATHKRRALFQKAPTVTAKVRNHTKERQRIQPANYFGPALGAWAWGD